VIVNTYAVLDAVVAALRLALAPAVVGLAVAALRRWRAAADPAAREVAEPPFYLAVALAGLLLALDVLAWPLFYLLLQSYVPQWPGVMCVYGVTRVGAGSVGPARFLPPLLAALQGAKPLLVFVSGGWLVIHLVNRETRTAPLTGRVLGILLLAGVLAGADAAAELAYLLNPKREVFLSAGCCAAGFDDEHDPGRFLPPGLLGADAAAWLYPAYYAGNAAAVLVLLAAARACGRRPAAIWAPALAATAAGGLAVNAVFLTEAAAPALLHQPGHHCPYDLVAAAPAGVAATIGG
jgi:hypothetical protein